MRDLGAAHQIKCHLAQDILAKMEPVFTLAPDWRRNRNGAKMRFNLLNVLAQGLSGNKGWGPHWRKPAPKPNMTCMIIGGGGHGLSTAYYLAKNHGMTNIAVLEKGYLGSGNIGRNTTIVRANYFLPGNSEFYSHSLKLWEGLEGDLNYNVMHSASVG
jgi:methylglutamate dehydrogenase subunit A